MTTSPWTTRYYARVPTQFLGRLLSCAAGGSAIHKAIRDEIARRAFNNGGTLGKHPLPQTCLLFSAEEWSRTLCAKPPSLPLAFYPDFLPSLTTPPF
jgi:hypothetical protein